MITESTLGVVATAKLLPTDQRELGGAPVAAIAGASDGDAEKLSAAFGINTVRDLGTNKYFRLAQALVDLGGHAD
jgi:hypothetical protein